MENKYGMKISEQQQKKEMSFNLVRLIRLIFFLGLWNRTENGEKRKKEIKRENNLKRMEIKVYFMIMTNIFWRTSRQLDINELCSSFLIFIHLC